MSSLSEKEYKAVLDFMVLRARVNFNAFLTLLFPPDYSSYILSKMHVHLAELVQECVTGTGSSRHCVSVPPQTGKSSMLSVRGVSWIVGKYAGDSVALTGFSYSLLTDFLRDIRELMESPVYQEVFPDCKPVRGQNKKDQLKLTNGSSIIIKTTGSKLTGRRVDWLIIDDPHAGRAEAESQVQRANVLRWYFGDCETRLAPNARVFIIMTRWHPLDLVGELTSEERVADLRESGYEDRIFKITNISAVADHNPDAGQADILGRDFGESCFPELRDTRFFLGLKAGMPRYEWDSQYMGRPRASASGQVDVTRIGRVKLAEVPTDIPWVRGWDLALTEKQTSDFSAGALCAYDKRTELLYLINVQTFKLGWMKMKPRFIDVSLQDKAQYNSNKAGLEAVAGFDIGLRELQSALSGDVMIEKRNPPKGGKLMRAQGWLNLIEAGRFRMVGGSWNKEVVDSIDAFPDVEHDDIEDAISVAFECIGPQRKKLLYA